MTSRKPPTLAMLLAGIMMGAGCAAPASPGGSATVDTTAPPAAPALDKGSIAGLVTDVEQRPIQGAAVALLGPDLSAITDAGGAFTFNDLDPGSYALTAQRLGYVSHSVRVNLKAGEVTTARLALEPIVISESYVHVRTYSTFIQLGQAYVDNRVPVWLTHCNECDHYVPLTPNPSGVQLEVTFTNGVPTPTTDNIWIDLRRNWTNDTAAMPISDGTTVGNAYLQNRAKWTMTDANVKALRTNKVNILWYHSASGDLSPSVNKRITSYLSFGYGGPIPDEHSALPPT